MQTVKELIQEKCNFLFYRKGELHYATDKSNFTFVVPISDAGDGEFHTMERGITMMRYIRKQLEANKAGREEV